MTQNLPDIENSVLKSDGSFRDFNFYALSLSSAADLIDWFIAEYRCIESNDVNGELIESKMLRNRVLKLNDDSSLVMRARDSENVIPYVQVLLFKNEFEKVEIEDSFYPGDINQKYFTIEWFMNLLQIWQSLAQAKIGYLRYENASWRFGDLDEDAGVFHVSKRNNKSLQAKCDSSVPALSLRSVAVNFA